MRKEFKVLVAVLLVLRVVVWLTGCGEKEVHEAKVVPNVVRVYDVESQDRARISKTSYEGYLSASDQLNSSDVKQRESAEKIVAGYDEIMFIHHEYRLGVFTGVGQGAGTPYSWLLSQVEKDTGIDIEYILKDNWEEVRKEIAETKDDGVTTIVLFNNSYDESLLKAAVSGNYVNMEAAMEDAGLYDTELYHQRVIDAGKIDGGQYLVPLLYTVPGMIHGERSSMEKPIAITSVEEYDSESLSYDEFLIKLDQAMEEVQNDVMNVPFLSAGFYEKQPDIFLLASGLEWDDYENQKDLFKILLDYVKAYNDSVNDLYGMTNQELYMMYLEMNERNTYGDPLTEGMMEDLRIEMPGEMPLEFATTIVSDAYMDRIQYFVESTGADDIAFHSILGLLSYSKYYCPGPLGEQREYGTMEYYPVGIIGENSAFSAQPVSYAAVVEGGSEEMAAKVIMALLNGKVQGKFGLSPCKEVEAWQMEEWRSGAVDLMHIRSIIMSYEGDYILDINAMSEWGSTGSSGGEISRAVAAEQLREQIDNVVVAEIPDREILAIWQDTLTETVDSGLSAEAGFELLCERMDAWYGK